jgi:hypothetical protein
MGLDSERRSFDQPVVLPPSAALLETRRAVRHAPLWGLWALGLAILEELQEVSVHPLDSLQEFFNPNGFGS